MSKHGSPTDTIRAIMSGQLNEHAPLHIDPPYDVGAALKVLHDAGCASATKVDDKTISVSAGDSQMAARVLTNALNKGAIPAPIKLVSAESVAVAIDATRPTTNPVKEEAQLKPDETHVNSDYEVVRDLINKKENQLKKIDEVSRGTLQSYSSKAHRSKASHLGKAGRAADDSNYHSNNRDEANANAAKSLNHLNKADKRDKGIGLAAAKLGHNSGVKAKIRASESVSYVCGKIEQINELSKNTLRNYIVKASAQAAKHNYASGVHAGANYQEKDPGERGRNSAHQKAHGQKADKRFNGIAKAANKLAEEEQIEEGNAENKVKKNIHAVKIGYSKSIHKLLPKDGGKHSIGKSDYVHLAADQSGHSVSHEYKSTADRFKRDGRAHLKSGKIAESLELTEGKKDDQEKAAKAFAAHPQADKMFQSMQHAAKTCNYVTDACDHVYNNHRENVSYADWHDMKPHIEAHFRERKLEG